MKELDECPSRLDYAKDSEKQLRTKLDQDRRNLEQQKLELDQSEVEVENFIHELESANEYLLNIPQIDYNMAMDSFRDLAKEKGLVKPYYKS